MTACAAVLMVLCAASAAASEPAIQDALDRMYNFDFPSAHRILDKHIAANPADALGMAMRGAAYLFQELDRLRILESEFLADDKRIADNKKLKPDPVIRDAFYKAIEEARARAKARLAQAPDDTEALFATCIAAGLVTDYMALVEKRQFKSLGHAKESQSYAVRLLRIAPQFYDAYLTTGVSEYLLGSLPFFVRWFVRFEGAQGSKAQAVMNLELVARSGRYLGPFARILLSLIHLREKRPRESERLLAELARDYPENPLFRKELAKIGEKLRNGELVDGGSR